MTRMKAAATGVMVAALGGLSFAQTNEPARAPALPVIPKTWADVLTLKGDFRYRHEEINDDTKLDSDGDHYTRNRDRIRARLAAEAKIDDQLKAGIGFSTGGSDPISGNSTLTDAASKKEMRLDLGYIDYSLFPDTPGREVHGIAGKMKNPFMMLPDDLVFDGDLNPEGVAAKGEFGSGFAILQANGGYFWVQERDSKDPAMLYAGQSAVRLEFVPEAVLTVGASYFGFQDMQGYDVIDWEGKNNAYGNSTVSGSVSGGVTNKAWASEFTPVVYFAKLDLRALRLPLSLHAAHLTNVDAETSEDAGQSYGFTFGKAKNPKTFELGYSWTELEKDATPGLWTDSDRWGGGTDGRGHKFTGRYQIRKGLQAGITYFLDEKKIADGTDADYNRLQLDLVASF